MLAARMYDINDIRIEEMPVPKIREDEILLQVKAAAICGTDVRMVGNGYKGISPDNPRILGHEFSGIIAETGSGVSNYRPGQRVAVAPNMGCGICGDCVRGDTHLCKSYRALGIQLDGGFAEFVKIPAEAIAQGNVTPIDDHVSFEEAAINEALSCVCNGFERCNIRPGDDVLVIGAGPIGIMHAMMAHMAGAGRVYISDLSEERLEICKKLNSSFIAISEKLEETIMKDTVNEGVDVCITACPSPAAQAQALELCGINGRINFFGGIPANRQPVALDTNLIHYKQLIVSGTTRASLTQFRKTLKFISTGILNVKPLISRTMHLSEINQGFKYAKSADGLKNVIVF
jgi:L-iditol 2-dehydrogenase